MHRKRPPRLSPENYLGPRRYFLTICTHRRLAVLSKAEVVQFAIDQLRTRSEKYQLAVIAYCFMPDHVHLLVEGMTDESDVQQFVRVWKQKTAFWFKCKHAGILWQRGFLEHILRSEESTFVRAGYVLTNPGRAGLVRTATEYPWIGSFVTTVEDLLERAQSRNAERELARERGRCKRPT